MNAPNDLTALIINGGNRDEKIAAQPLFIRLGFVFFAVFQQTNMRTEFWRIFSAMRDLITIFSDKFLWECPQSFRHGIVYPQDFVLCVQDHDEVRHCIEGSFPFLFSFDGLGFGKDTFCDIRQG